MPMCNGGGCVAVDDTAEDGTVYLSSTRRPEVEPAELDTDEWLAFLADVKAGRYGGDTAPAEAAVEQIEEMGQLRVALAELRVENECLRAAQRQQVRRMTERAR